MVALISVMEEVIKRGEVRELILGCQLQQKGKVQNVLLVNPANCSPDSSCLEPTSQTFVNMGSLPVTLGFSGISVQPTQLPGCALTLTPAVQCKKLSLLL